MNPTTSECTRKVEALAQHLHVLPDLTGFVWFGVERPAVRGSSDGFSAGDRRRFLVDAVTNCLYENFYCTGGATGYIESSPDERSAQHSPFVQAILNANNTRIAWSELKVLRVTRSVVVSSGGSVAIHTDRASPLLQTVDGRRISKADGTNFPPFVRVGARSWTLSGSPGFILMIGEREPRTAVTLQRTYWSLRHTGAAEFVAAATYHLNRQHVPFRLKVLAEPPFYSKRLDVAVVYLDLRTENARDGLVETFRETGHRLRSEVPAMTRRIATGLAVAEDPGEGMSFGMHRCRLIAEAFVQGAESGLIGPADILACVESVFADHEIDLCQPHRLKAADDPYTREIETVLSQTTYRQPGRAQSSSSPPSDQSWLAIAAEVGRQLSSEAFWDKSRCQWVGGETLPSGNPVFRTLPASLYHGTAGIGHFLAELAVRTNSEEAAVTALGAVRQALATSDSDGPSSLYVGSLGVAIIAIRVARRLGDPNLADQATGMSRRLAIQPLEQSPEQSPDLLTGYAGQILGLLILADLVPDQLFKQRAVEVGQLLVEQAEHDQPGWSWPNRRIESARNLTGLSHGAAGIAFALGELWRSTGDPSFRAAATEALAYEDAAFNKNHSNWPDYRQFGPESKKPSFANFWCHGASGIVLSRLHLSRVMGLGELPPHLPGAVEAMRQVVDANLHQVGANFCLCHGIAGNAEILWEASRWGQTGASWQQRAASTADACWRVGATFHASTRTWPCGASVDNPSLLLGRAGIGYAYLRVHDSSVPSILAVEPAKWGYPGVLSKRA
jgi:hypothetical protein